MRVTSRCTCSAAAAAIASHHIENGQIRSPETLGTVLPGLAGQLYRTQFDDPRHGLAYASTYEAFHRRRSLLLRNLESQVRLQELPWIAALPQF